MKKILFTSLITLCTTVATANVQTIDAGTAIHWHPRAIYNALTNFEEFLRLPDTESFDILFSGQNMSSNELCYAFVNAFYALNVVPPVGCEEFIHLVIKEHNYLVTMAREIREITGLEPYEPQIWDKSLSMHACTESYAYFLPEASRDKQIQECGKIEVALERNFGVGKNEYIMSLSDFIRTCNSTLSGHNLYKPDAVNKFCFNYLGQYTFLQNEVLKAGEYDIPHLEIGEKPTTSILNEPGQKPDPVSEPEQKSDPVSEPEQEPNGDDMSVEYKRKRDIQEKAIVTIENTIEQTKDLLRTIDEARHDRRVEEDKDTLEYLHDMINRVEKKMAKLKTLQDRIHRDNITKKEATQILNEAQALSEEIKDLGNRILEKVGSISVGKFEDWN